MSERVITNFPIPTHLDILQPNLLFQFKVNSYFSIKLKKSSAVHPIVIFDLKTWLYQVYIALTVKQFNITYHI